MSRITKVLTLAAAAFVLSTGAATAAVPGQSAGTGQVTVAVAEVQAQASVRSKIVSVAKSELANKSRNREKGAKNCNYYSGKVGGGSTKGCPKGWKAEAWCADFLKFVWKQAGASTSGITPAAASLYSYGKKHKTWNPGKSIKGVKAGDAVVYNLNKAGTWASHVGIVTKVDTKSGKITVISGNSGKNSMYVAQRTFVPDNTVSGYVSPKG
ncbi:CHAP domain-containing protein [Actinokineospora sp. NPDC004072]